MIRITRQGKTHVTLEGHAHSDVYGKDLICASASILALTLGANVGHMADSGCVTEPIVKLEEGPKQLSDIILLQFRQYDL